MLFRVSGSDVFVCGTVHFLPDGVRLPSALFSTVASADDCIFESDLENASEPEYARYPGDDSISEHISSDLFDRVSDLCADLDLSGLLPKFKPWWVTVVIGVHLIHRAGYRLDSGVDRQLWNAAKRAGKLPFVLESIEALRAFDVAPIAEQIDRLEFVVSNPDLAGPHVQRLYEAWQAGDAATLTQELQTQIRLSPVTYRALIPDRNRRWLPQILAAIDRGRSAVFVVGALHLAGDYSLQRLLGEHGKLLLPV
ncbi:MAG: TraB/GumN family protein [Thermoanaerobaculia bacterium]|jgi:hypothetical protein